MSNNWPFDSESNIGSSATSPVVESPKKNNKTVIIIIVVIALVILLCCCIAFLIWLWNNGDQLIEQISALLTTATMLL